MADAGAIEIKALIGLTQSTLFYTGAFIFAFWGLKKAVVDGDNKGWLIVFVAALVSASSGIFNAVREFGYGVIEPLDPSGSAAGLEGAANVLQTKAGAMGSDGVSGDGMRPQPSAVPFGSSNTEGGRTDGGTGRGDL